MQGYEYWDKYKAGETKFIEVNRDHPRRRFFAEYVLNQEIESVLEIGPGEMIEYQMIRERKPDIDYTVVDVSQGFIDNCKEQYPNVTAIHADVNRLNIDRDFDIIHVASVLEHMKNVSGVIGRLIKAAKRFHISMFKWKYAGRSKSTYINNHWSSTYNINDIFQMISKYGEIEDAIMISRDGNLRDLRKYARGRTNYQRDGRHAVIMGVRK